MKKKSLTLVLVEGSISAGKSTALRRAGGALRTRGHVVVDVPEPLERWGDGLVRMYEDTPRWAFAFQVRAFGTRATALREAVATAPDGAILLVERSIHSDRAIFFRAFVDDGVVDEYERDTYEAFFPHVVADVYAGFARTLVLYMRSEPARCHERMRGRARDGESSVTLAYLERLHDAHERALVVDGAREWGPHVTLHTIDVEAHGNLAESAEVADEYATIIEAVLTAD